MAAPGTSGMKLIDATAWMDRNCNGTILRLLLRFLSAGNIFALRVVDLFSERNPVTVLRN
jgi:hypothetical protein